MQSSTAFKNENDTNCFHDSAIYQKLDRGLGLDEPTNVDGCVQKKVNQFYFIKYWPYEDQTLKSRIEDAEKLYKRITSDAWSLADKFEARLLDQRNAFTELRCISSRNTEYMLEWTLNKLDQLQAALNKLNYFKFACQRGDIKSCSSGEFILYATQNE